MAPSIKLLALPCLSLLLLAGCSTDSGGSTPKPVVAPEVQSLRFAGLAEWTPEADALTLPCGDAPPLLLTVGPGQAADELGQWLLSPPDTCDGAASCGHLQLTLTPSEGEPTTLLSASRTVDLEPAVLGTGTKVTVKVALLNDYGEQTTLPDGSTAEVTVAIPLSRPTSCP